MKFPFVRRKKHDDALRREKVRRVKAKESSKRSKKAAERAKANAQNLEAQVAELLSLQEALSNQLDEVQRSRNELVAQVQGHRDLRSLFSHKLSGEGIEIGALHFPLLVPPGVKVRYVDKRTKKENEDEFPELAGKPIVETDWIGDGQWLEGMADESQDFVIANHMLEHCVNPLKTLEHFLRVLKPGGRLFISLPDKRFTFDVNRTVTPFSHVLEDYRMNREVEDREVYEEYRDLIKPSLDVDKALRLREDVHHHVWTQAEMLELFTEARRQLGWPLEIELVGKQGIEVVFVLQKIEPVQEDHAKFQAPPTNEQTPVVEKPLEAARGGSGTGNPGLRSVVQQAAGAIGSYAPLEWLSEGAHLQIEETWSTDSTMGIRGFVLVHAGEPQDVRFTCRGVPPTHIEWNDRPDVYGRAPFAKFPRHVKCGFIAVFPRQAVHTLTATLPPELGSHQKVMAVTATGLAPAAPMEHGGLSLAGFAEKVNRECQSVLEIGSRIVSPGSVSKRSLFSSQVKFTGFDYYPDGNTDVVGDAHRLSTYFPDGQKFDSVFSVSVLEHLAMPWVAAMEMNRILKVGGLAFHSTPFTWPLHETPWDFWRYSHEGLRMLFSPAIGFEVLEMGLTGPCRMHFETIQAGPPTVPVHRAYAEANILVRKVGEVDLERFRWDTSLQQVLPQESAYPKLD